LAGFFIYKGCQPANGKDAFIRLLEETLLKKGFFQTIFLKLLKISEKGFIVHTCKIMLAFFFRNRLYFS